MSFFGQNLRFLRNSRQMSQSAFAEVFGLKRTAVGAYEEERAEPKLDLLVKIANYFGVSLEDILCQNLQDVGVSAQRVDNEGIPLIKTDELPAFAAAVADGAAYSCSQYIRIPGVADTMIAVEFGRSILVVDSQQLDGIFWEADHNRRYLVLKRSGIAIATGRVVDADVVRCYKIHYIIKCFDSDDHTALMLEDISARLRRMESVMDEGRAGDSQAV